MPPEGAVFVCEAAEVEGVWCFFFFGFLVASLGEPLESVLSVVAESPVFVCCGVPVVPVAPWLPGPAGLFS